MKFTDKCISVTDLRLKTKECLTNLEEGERYIFVNNKPTAVLVDINIFEKLQSPIELREMPANEISLTLKSKVENAKKLSTSSFINI